MTPLIRPRRLRFLDLTVRRQFLLAAVVLFSLVATIAVVLAQPPRYEGRAVVFLSKYFPGRSGFDMDPFVATFQASLSLPEATLATAEATGLPVDEIARGLSSTRPTQGTIVSISFKGASRPDAAAQVPREAALAALRNLAGQERAQAEAQLEQAFAAAQKAQEELSAFESSTAFSNLDAEIETVRQRVAALRTSQPNGPELAAATKTLAELGALRSRRDVLLSRLEAANDDLVEAEGNARVAAGRVTAIDTPGLITQGAAARQPRTTAVARGAVGSLLVSLSACLALFALADARVRRRIVVGPQGAPAPNGAWAARYDAPDEVRSAVPFKLG